MAFFASSFHLFAYSIIQLRSSMYQEWETLSLKEPLNHMKKVTSFLIINYLLDIGDWVELDEVVAMVETDKITVDIRSPE